MDPLQDIYKSVKEAYLALGVNTVDTVAQVNSSCNEHGSYHKTHRGRKNTKHKGH